LLTSLFAVLPTASAGAQPLGHVVNPGIADLRAAQAGAPLPAIATPLTTETASPTTETSPLPVGPYGFDGTLVLPTSQPQQAAFQVRVYAVTAGDTLTGIAARFGLSMMSIWWANNLTSKDQLHVGQLLLIPPVDGVLYTAQAGDTVAAVAARFHADPTVMATFNDLTTDELTLGEQVMIPNGVGPSIAATPAVATASRTAKVTSTTRTTTVGCTGCGFAPLLWPVKGGYISQGYGCTGFSYEPPVGDCAHYHSGIDIAAPSGTSIVAAAAGTILYAGWKDNDGGYQLWVSDGHDYYTGYYHLSALLVHAGQTVGRGQLIGRVGSTGHSTGPHLYFQVWIGRMWDGGTTVNPLGYF